jgi:hypothetical protein
MKLKDFIKKSSLDAPLIRAVILQFGSWEYFQETAKDITQHGADSGFNGFIYYTDTVKFTRRHKVKILELASEMDSQIEGVGTIQFITGFNCLKGITADEVAKAIYTGRGDDVTQVYNALAWFALEEVTRSLVDLQDDETYSN